MVKYMLAVYRMTGFFSYGYKFLSFVFKLGTVSYSDFIGYIYWSDDYKKVKILGYIFFFLYDRISKLSLKIAPAGNFSYTIILWCIKTMFIDKKSKYLVYTDVNSFI